MAFLICALAQLSLLLSVLGGDTGVWVTDDGERAPLTEDMMLSRGGYKHIRVGADRGIVASPSGGLTAVRRDSSTADSLHSDPPTAELRAAVAQAQAARARLRARCPHQPSDETCNEWCAAVAPRGLLLEGHREGPACSEGIEPDCVCHRRGDGKRGQEWARCRATCPTSSANAEPKSPSTASTTQAVPKTTTTTTTSRPTSSPSPTVSTSQSSTPEKGEQAAQPSRYLLYDTRYGLSFAEQLGVFLALARLVTELNKQVSSSCPSDTKSPSCLPWTLVLPPWCSVVKWYAEDGGQVTAWKALFDMRIMRLHVPAIEFATYSRRVGGASVELAVLPAVVPDAAGEAARRDFGGWQRQPEACAAEGQGQTMPQRGAQPRSLVYSGYCNGDVTATDFRCGLLRTASQRALLDLLSAIKRGTRQVLLKHVDALGLHSHSHGNELRPALRPAQALQEAAETFVAKALGQDFPYLAVHLRQNDFRRLHPATTPSAAAAAARVNFLLRERRLEQVFVATDAPQAFKEALRLRVKAPLYYFADDDGASVPTHRGEEEMVVLGVLAGARYFVGSQGSAFSALVRGERRLRLGAGEAKEEGEVFCDNLSELRMDRRCTE